MEWIKSLTGSSLSFLSAGYLLFLTAAALVRYLCPPKGRTIAILLISWAFYCTWNPACLAFLLVTTVSTFLTGQLLGSARRKSLLILCLVLNLAILFGCKYWTMLFPGGFSQVLLPMGISFYTLQALGYVIDCYRGDTEAEKSFISYALFVAFFPGITSGPIERGRNLLPQIHSMEDKNECYENLRNGILILFWGYFLKLVLADRIAIVVNAVYSDPQRWKGCIVVLAVLLYSVQIYCDFAGYSAIAIGSARILGFRVMQNFAAPYLSASIGEFWRRWHISLSTWFRDYLYIPLGGMTFLFWGLLHGIYQVIGTFCKAGYLSKIKSQKTSNVPFSRRLLQTAGTFLLVSFAWIFFRAESFGKAWEVIRCMGGVTLWQLTDGTLLQLGLDGANWALLVCSVLLLLIRDLCVRRGISLRKEILQQELWLRWILYIGVILLILVCGVWGPGYDAATFIYSQF